MKIKFIGNGEWVNVLTGEIKVDASYAIRLDKLARQHNLKWKGSDVYSPSTADWLLSDSRVDKGIHMVRVDPLTDSRFSKRCLTLPECKSVHMLKEYLQGSSRGKLCKLGLKVGGSSVNHKGWFSRLAQGAQAYGVVMVDNKATEKFISKGKENCSVISSRKLKIDGMRLLIMRASFVEVQKPE